MSATWTDRPPAPGVTSALTPAELKTVTEAAARAGVAAQGKSTGTAVTGGSAGRCHPGMLDDPGPEAVAAAMAAGWNRTRKAPPPG